MKKQTNKLIKEFWPWPPSSAVCLASWSCSVQGNTFFFEKRPHVPKLLFLLKLRFSTVGSYTESIIDWRLLKAGWTHSSVITSSLHQQIPISFSNPYDSHVVHCMVHSHMFKQCPTWLLHFLCVSSNTKLSWRYFPCCWLIHYDLIHFAHSASDLCLSLANNVFGSVRTFLHSTSQVSVPAPHPAHWIHDTPRLRAWLCLLDQSHFAPTG